MGEIVLVRHGQANSAAKTEADYDRLSDLGHRQAEWLGDWFRDQGEVFDDTFCGSLNRHHQTADAMGAGERHEDPRLNEMDYFNLGHALEASHGVPFPGPDEFAAHVPQVMNAWHDAQIMGNETFAAFESRITAALTEAATEGRRVLCITSGGVIGMVMRHILQLDPTRLAHVLLPIRNTSVHRLWIRDDAMILSGFNATPHLDRADRAAARTTY
ncbi:histidine phosphatase family protein [Oceaniglobus indicus]|uniref:histidine phosphatase family protein n=1 Tax=Oceaniglobus indicus TaxID=2047749 RepID=UPI000C18DD80|nr:histidine phosphatase family protein [Oceaniglobus indicus]